MCLTSAEAVVRDAAVTNTAFLLDEEELGHSCPGSFLLGIFCIRDNHRPSVMGSVA